jgi:hypothetical protein
MTFKQVTGEIRKCRRVQLALLFALSDARDVAEHWLEAHDGGSSQCPCCEDSEWSKDVFALHWLLSSFASMLCGAVVHPPDRVDFEAPLRELLPRFDVREPAAESRQVAREVAKRYIADKGAKSATVEARETRLG